MISDMAASQKSIDYGELSKPAKGSSRKSKMGNSSSPLSRNKSNQTQTKIYSTVIIQENEGRDRVALTDKHDPLAARE